MEVIFLRHYVRFQRLETLYSPSTMKNKTAEKSFKKKKECLKENNVSCFFFRRHLLFTNDGKTFYMLFYSQHFLCRSRRFFLKIFERLINAQGPEREFYNLIFTHTNSIKK